MLSHFCRNAKNAWSPYKYSFLPNPKLWNLKALMAICQKMLALKCLAMPQQAILWMLWGRKAKKLLEFLQAFRWNWKFIRFFFIFLNFQNRKWKKEDPLLFGFLVVCNNLLVIIFKSEEFINKEKVSLYMWKRGQGILYN